MQDTDAGAPLTPSDVAEVGGRIIDAVEQVIVGKRSTIELLLVGLLADGNIVIEDLPGLAKTLMARSLAETTGLTWSRVQFTPDLMPADVTGSSIYDPSTTEFLFRPGPIFANLVLGDEINRAPPKTQAALLEAMAERQVTSDGVTHPLERPFLVLATQNPIEYEGTYPLPEAQLDRFLLRVSVGYPEPADEREILERRMARRTDDTSLEPVIDRETLLRLQAAVETVHVDSRILDYVVAIVTATRSHPSLSTGASPRGSLALLKTGRARAALAGRDFVNADDIKSLAGPTLAHRVSLRPELWVQGIDPGTVIDACCDQVETPSADDVLSEARGT